MGLFNWLFGESVQSSEEDLTIAEEYLSSQCSDEHITALVRHYAVTEVTDDIERFTGARLNDGDTVKIVQGLRDKYGMGPIADYNLPGYVCPEDQVEDQEERTAYYRDREIERREGGLLGWLFR